MKEFTQTTLGAIGNCWQTAVACLLEVDPVMLPDQSICDRKNEDGTWQPSYGNRLRAYLNKHHDLAYVEVYQPGVRELVLIRDPGWHLMTGETVRTGVVPGCERHVVVGRYGEVAWDPHPSRAGLTNEIRLAFLVPFPEEWRESDKRTQPDPCFCPACIRERGAE